MKVQMGYLIVDAKNIDVLSLKLSFESRSSSAQKFTERRSLGVREIAEFRNVPACFNQ